MPAPDAAQPTAPEQEGPSLGARTTGGELIALHADDTTDGLYGFAKGHQLTRHVLEPALEAARGWDIPS